MSEQQTDLRHLESLAAGGDRDALRRLVRELRRGGRYDEWLASRPFPTAAVARFEAVAELRVALDGPVDPGERFVSGWTNQRTLAIYDSQCLSAHAALSSARPVCQYALHPDGHHVAELGRELSVIDTRVKGRKRVLAQRKVPRLPLYFGGRLPEGPSAGHGQLLASASVVFDASGEYLWLAHYESEPDDDGRVWPRLSLLASETLEEVDAVGPDTLRWWTWQTSEGVPMSSWGGESGGLVTDASRPDVAYVAASAGDDFLGFTMLRHEAGRIDRELAGPGSLALSSAYHGASDGDPLWDVAFSRDGERLFVLDSIGMVTVLSFEQAACETGRCVALFDVLNKHPQRARLVAELGVQADARAWLAAGWGGLRVDDRDRLIAELAVDGEPALRYAFDADSLAPLGRVEPGAPREDFTIAAGALFVYGEWQQRSRRSTLSRLVGVTGA